MVKQMWQESWLFWARSQNCVKRRLGSSCPSAWDSSAPTWQIFMKFGLWVFFENLSRLLSFDWNLRRITNTSREDIWPFVLIYRRIILRMADALHMSCRENQNTNFMFNNLFSRKSYRLWYNVEKYEVARQATGDNIIGRMRISCWMTKATDTQLCVTVIALPRQKWLCEHATMLLLHVQCLSCFFTSECCSPDIQCFEFYLPGKPFHYCCHLTHQIQCKVLVVHVNPDGGNIYGLHFDILSLLSEFFLFYT